MATRSDESEITVVGAPRTLVRDVYHRFLVVRWPVAIGAIVVSYLGLNTLFAAAYYVSGGVANARPGSLFDVFCFSVQTMGTIGYGAMYPTTAASNTIVVVESVTSLLVTALATGLVFAKFSRSTARVAFSNSAVIGPMEGVPTLMVRVGNERGNAILEATLRITMTRTEKTKEGMTFYKLYDLRLVRERSPMMRRSWTVLHRIDDGSPLLGGTPETVERDEIELVVTLAGVDDTSMQPVHARKRYRGSDILWGARHADILSEGANGSIILDVRRFHDVVPTEPMDGFPYRLSAPALRRD
ncbi:MAG TPA: ion channel [Polyangiaceae bacterium]|nr:ion channel [Polyangiaceae bacterium]